jgi:predicted RNA-binding protein associated with RNAse of E/G family
MRFGGSRRERYDWEPELYWYVHVADINWDSELEAWIFKDLSADILASKDGLTYRVKDLHEVALAVRLGLVTQEKSGMILEHAQTLLDAMKDRGFPFPELQDAIEQDDDLMRRVETPSDR